jgi:hypothetical protein
MPQKRVMDGAPTFVIGTEKAKKAGNRFIGA